MLVNGIEDAGGEKEAMVHACESDADGALTMQILHLLSDGKPVALLDIRWYDAERGVWTLANCGAVPAALCACGADASGLGQINVQPHAFGRGGGGAFPGVVSPGPVTLARLCRKNGQYWMSIAPAEVVAADPEQEQRTTAAFPKAFVRFAAGPEFLAEYGSNHIHLVRGDLTEELTALCGIAGIPWKLWA
jgi:L-fucose isomerase